MLSDCTQRFFLHAKSFINVVSIVYQILSEAVLLYYARDLVCAIYQTYLSNFRAIILLQKTVGNLYWKNLKSTYCHQTRILTYGCGLFLKALFPNRPNKNRTVYFVILILYHIPGLKTCCTLHTIAFNWTHRWKTWIQFKIIIRFLWDNSRVKKRLPGMHIWFYV